MSYRTFICFFLFGISSMFSQDENSLPDIFPVSPQASSLGSYGSLPVDLSTGKINYQIPLYTIKIAGYTYPIFLGYNYSGLMTEQDSGPVGLGWVLNAAGRITRKVNGNPDESLLGYLGNSFSSGQGIGKQMVQPYHQGLLNSQEQLDLFNNSANGRWDTEPDEFSIQANGLTGNFFLNENGGPIFLPKKNYKVNFLDDLRSKITIVSDEGVIYEFINGEDTQHENYGNDSPVLSYKSSWVIDKISYPNTSETITFEYETFTYYKETYSESRSSQLGYGSCSEYVGYFSGTNYNLSATTINTKVLKKIIFPGGTAVFNNTLKNADQAGSSGGSILNSVTIFNLSNIVVEKFQFVYSNSAPENLKVLLRIDKLKNSKTQNFYSFDYYGSLPPTLNYKSQDLWGFYNGKSNSNLLDGDRSVSFNSTLNGALKKIVYPTKGSTEILYEQNGVQYSPYALGPDNSEIYTNTKFTVEANAAIDGNIQESVQLFIPEHQFVKISMNANVGGSTGIAEAETSVTGYSGNPDCPTSLLSYKEGSYIIDQADPSSCYYEILGPKFITLNYRVYKDQNSFASASINVEYYNVENSPDNSMPIGGIRVKETKDYSDVNTYVSTSYKYLEESGKTSGVLLNRPFYKTSTKHTGPCGDCDTEDVSAFSNIPMISYNGSAVIYGRVEILKNSMAGDKEGKIINYYQADKNLPNTVFSAKDNKDWRKGLLLKSEIFQLNASIPIVVEENIYEFFQPYSLQTARSNSQISVSFKARKKIYRYSGIPTGGGCVLAISNSIYDFASADPYFLPEFYEIAIIDNKESFDGIDVYSRTYYNYDSLFGNVKQTLIKDSKGDQFLTTFKYPFDVLTTNSLGLNPLSSSEKSALDNLRTLNNISKPIQTESFIDRNKNSLPEESERQKTVRKNYKSGISLSLIERIQNSKGDNSLEDRLIYQRYDSSGNPLEVSQADGPPMVYIWGYSDQQPIAKIENATYQQVASALSVPVSTLDTYTEANLAALNALRNNTGLSQAMITTYTYEPLVGVKTITDPKGFETTFEYDAFNRLEFIKDADGNIIKENKYNYIGE